MSSTRPFTRGSISVICGPMFSGKTEELIRRIHRSTIANRPVQVFKSGLDNRYAGIESLSSHAGRTAADVTPISKSSDVRLKLLPSTALVVLDEAQFLDDDVVVVAQGLALEGIHVIAAGLDTDFRGLPFGPMPALLAVAEEIVKLTAICRLCGENATRTQRIIDNRPAPFDAPLVLVAHQDAYEARCRYCHEVPQA